ncbi:MAG: DUF2752 domain-containing protein [Pseudobutyrivibrio sp.]|nr:DUF2752 domain-containing protein [Pseudobutyrivibrio sp.]
MLFLVLSGIYVCPFRLLVGIPCPCCGITRAILSALKGDFDLAFYYHPLWLPAIIAIAGLFLYELNILKIPKLVGQILLGILAVLIIICYVLRLINHTLV